MTCLTCKHWNLQPGKPLAHFGLAACAVSKPWTFLPPQHSCPKHQPAPPKLVAERQAWLDPWFSTTR